MAFGLLVTGLLVGAKISFEHTALGHRVERWAYEVLHFQLPYFNQSEELPVVVVDISKMPGGRAGAPTSREELKKLLGAIAAEKPSAIAVDVDFSPDGKGWITDDDPQFLDYCLDLAGETGVPVYLGVFRAKAQPPETWLGLPKYSGLAVALLVTGEDVSRLPRWVQARGGKQLRALSWALATAHKPTLLSPTKCNSWLFECSADRQPGTDRHPNEHFAVSDFLVNYSKLEELRRETLLTGSEQSVKEFGVRLKGKMVILGDALEFTDPFIVPGQEQPVAGAYLHASAAYTLVQEPLREFNLGFRLLLDGIISLIFIVGIFFVRGRRGGVKGRRAQTWFLVSAIGVVLVAGVLLVRWYNVMWLDFLLVGFALLLHPKVEGWLESGWHNLSSRRRKARAETGA
jgi:CHASE2 domain-containing sensor protein